MNKRRVLIPILAAAALLAADANAQAPAPGAQTPQVAPSGTPQPIAPAPVALPQPAVPGTAPAPSPQPANLQPSTPSVPVLTPPAYSAPAALTKLLNADPNNRTANADQPLCILFIVDVSGSMTALRTQGDGRRRIDVYIKQAQEMFGSYGLSHPDTAIGLMTASYNDPDASNFKVPLTRGTDRQRLDTLIRQLGEVRTEQDKGSNLRAAHLRGLEAIDNFCKANPQHPWRRYIVLMSDCYPDEPDPGMQAVDPARYQAARQVWQALQNPADPLFRKWQNLSGLTQTLVVEPYNRNWWNGDAKFPGRGVLRSVFPRELVSVSSSMQESEVPREGVFVVRGVVAKGPANSTSGWQDLHSMSEVTSATELVSGADLLYTISEPNSAPDRHTESTPDGQFLITVPVPFDGNLQRQVGFEVRARGFQTCRIDNQSLVPGGHYLMQVQLAPQPDPWTPLLLVLGGLLLVWTFWPWELRINANPAAATLHLFSPVQLYDAQTNQPVATVYHFLWNWLYVPGAGKVRVDGSTSARFRPIPARCRVEISDKRMATFLLESGFMRPGGSRPRGMAPPGGPAVRPPIPPRR